MLVGSNNKLGNCYYCFVGGAWNDIDGKSALLVAGYGLYTNSTYKIRNGALIGRYNTNPSLSDCLFVIGNGNDSSSKSNALEINASNCKILNNLQLAADATAVNAITPPQDPNNVTVDDQTLVTKSYLSSQIPSLSDYSKSKEILASAFSFSSSTPTASLTTPPAWCRVLQITVRVDGQNTTVNATYNPAPGVPHTLFEVNVKKWDSNANKFTFYWCEFEYSNTNNDITWIKWVGWDQDFSTGTITKIGDGIANFNTSTNPITLMSVIALA